MGDSIIRKSIVHFVSSTVIIFSTRGGLSAREARQMIDDDINGFVAVQLMYFLYTILRLLKI